MKKLPLTFCILLILVSVITSHAEDTTVDRTCQGQTLPKQKNKEDYPTSRPKAPSMMRVYFYYNVEEETCLFTLPENVEYIDITLTNLSTEAMYIGSVDQIDPVWHQALTPGEYYIECTADNGDIYSGNIYIF